MSKEKLKKVPKAWRKAMDKERDLKIQRPDGTVAPLDSTAVIDYVKSKKRT